MTDLRGRGSRESTSGTDPGDDSPQVDAPQCTRAAVFLDRDGTLIEDRGYLCDAAGVALLPGAVEALQRLRQAGYALVLVTNQSAIGRGLLDEAGLRTIHAALEAALAREGARLDAIYFCPDAPRAHESESGAGPQADRKPGAGMLLRAARELDLDLSRSWMIGDHVRDALAGRNAGCAGSVLVRTGQGAQHLDRTDAYDCVCHDVLDAARWILARPAAGE